MWYAILLIVLAVTLAGLLYLSFRAARLPVVRKLTRDHRWLARTLCLLGYGVLLALLWRLWNGMNAIICLLHLVLFQAAADLVDLIRSKLRRKPRSYGLPWAAALLLCVLYLGAGWHADHAVRPTFYSLETDKFQGDLRIVQIADAHVGTTFSGDGLMRYVNEINALKPDVVAVTGDFVDDDTSREDMLSACRALGALEARHGVFYVYGNHDKGYYSEGDKGWTDREFRESLLRNGVVMLEDQAYPIGDDLYIVGRKDRSQAQRGTGRQTAADLLSALDRGRYILLLDHQPHDFDAEAEAGADLVLCGHTHGGQFIPIRRVGVWIGKNCRTYGHERRLRTDFIVSSGISNWAFRFKTGCFSEYVIVDIHGR